MKPDPISRRLAGAASLAALLLAGAADARAESCCVDGACIDVAAGTCEDAGGVPGYCLVGEACLPAACDPAGLAPIADLRVSRSGENLRVSFTPDPSSNVTKLRMARQADGLSGCADSGEVPTPALWTTVDHHVLSPALVPDADLVFLCALPGCERPPDPESRGACCQAEGSCNDDLDLEECHAIDGFHQGAGSTCATASCGVVVADFTPCLFEENVLFMDGRNGDWVHPGADTILDADWPPANTGAPFVTINWRIVPTDTEAQGNYWRPEFSTYRLGHELRVGVYEDAQRAPFAEDGHPGLQVTGDHRGCNRIGGRFQILECVIVDGEVLAFAATWHQECEPATGTDYMDGCLRVRQ